MASYGFVYVLVNEGMPGLYKIGCTERSPHARAEELSSASGVPFPFGVLCYVETRDCFSLERAMHEWLKDSRVNKSREFFDADLRRVMSLMKHGDGVLSFAVVPSAFDMAVRYMVDIDVDLYDPFPPFPPIQSKYEQSSEDMAADAISAAKSGAGLGGE